MPATLRVGELLEVLGRRVPFEKAAAGDPVGLQIGDPAAAVRRVGVCHEVTAAVVDAAQRRAVELLISYHPLLYRPLTALVAGPTAAGRALRLARAGIALAVVHTAFDVARDGAADALAEALGVGEARPFAPLVPEASRKVATFVPESAADALLDAVAAAGAGQIGRYTHCSFRAPGTGTFYAPSDADPAVGRRGALNREPEVRLEFALPAAREAEVVAALLAAHPYEEPAYDVFERRAEAGLVGRVGRVSPGTRLGELARRAAQALGAEAPRVAGDPGRSAERVAVVPGAGAEFLGRAAAAGAEVLVTGDVSHHRAREALDRGLALIDPGHAATERPGLRRLCAWVAEAGVETESLLDLDPDPWAGPARA
jgi:dinuclear metal center YbgI/SA1388 family protein